MFTIYNIERGLIHFKHLFLSTNTYQIFKRSKFLKVFCIRYVVMLIST